ncbi:MAG: AAA family ATPase [Bacteroidales bacterium]|nr:AAA family ATPase [Bacteroidales bacterium]
MYYNRLIDKYLTEWAESKSRKPLLLRGARQVGKSTAVKNLGKKFAHYVEINLEKQPSFKQLFEGDLDVNRIVPQIAAMAGKPVVPGKTLLFIDEIQSSQNAIMSLRFFKEDMPELHVVAAGSLLEFALQELPTFGVGRIHSMFMYPMTFDEFLSANGEQLLINERNKSSVTNPLSDPLYTKLTDLFRTYLLTGGMPEAVGKWVETHDYLACQQILDDIIITCEDDFAKYKKKADPVLLRQTLRSAAVQVTQKFVYAQVGGGFQTNEVKKALEMLVLAGILIPVVHTSANGLPLGSESDRSYSKMLVLDSGLMLRLLNMTTGDISELTARILTDDVSNLVNKGSVAEMVAGLELLRYRTPNIRHELYYWQRQAKNSLAEIDYLTSYKSMVLPIEVKAGTRGGMKSLWQFMREKKLTTAIRCSLENFGEFSYTDPETGDVRNVGICPLFAVSQLERVMENK